MRYDFAPMEGITGFLFRQLHHQYFPGVDRYYIPFLSPTQDHTFTPRELREVLPENNQGLEVVPQLLTKSPEDFLWAAGELSAMGYQTVNLNLGCPSGTVVAKGKGAGMLRCPEDLERFLDTVFSRAPCAVSVKTRLGLSDAAEFGPILEIYNRYPISELIVHPGFSRISIVIRSGWNNLVPFSPPAGTLSVITAAWSVWNPAGVWKPGSPLSPGS